MYRNCYWVIPLSLVIALMLMMLPLPGWAAVIRPDLVALVLIYWAMAMPRHAGVTLGWVFGLLLDVSYGTLLGQHALGLLIVAYLVHKMHQRVRVFSLVQQALVVFLLLIVKQAMVLWVSGMIGLAPDVGLIYFAPSLIGALFWPWLFIILRDVRRKFCRQHM